MRYERLVVEAEEHTFTLELHPRLTVIAGVGPLEREGLVNELVGALGSTRAGVHAEIVSDAGAHFAIFRPVGARHRVVSIDAAVDVSDRFRNRAGEIDLLARVGLDARLAKRRMRVTGAELAAASQADHLIARLARIDPMDLWPAADRVRLAEDHLQAEAEAVGSAPEDASVMQRIEERHQAFEQAQSRHERYRRFSFLTGALAALIAVPMAMAAGAVAAGLPLLAASVITGMSFLEFKRMERAAREESEALRAAGAQSYLGFHLQRVNGLLASDQARRRLMRAGEEHREALATWRALAGDVDATWALEHRLAIDAAHRDSQGLPTVASDLNGASGRHPSALARALGEHLQRGRTMGPAGESFPLILDDPLAGVSSSQKPPLLELLVETSTSQQLIYLTEDEEVASWARLEALTGELIVLEPAEHVEAREAAQASREESRSGAQLA